MTWVKGGDTAPTHPKLEATVTHPDADDRTRCEVFGWLMLCAMKSTAHGIEYFIPLGSAIREAGSPEAARRNISVALHAGLITEVTLDGDTAYKILEDDNFIHLITKEERDEQAQRKRDRNRGDLVVPARIRDGDVCRYCGVVVNWGTNSSNLAGTYEHLRGVAVDQDTKLDDYVISCKGCNTLVSNLKLTYEQKLKRLMPAPSDPKLKPSSVEWLKAHRWTIANNIAVPKPWRRRLKVGEVVRTSQTSDGTQPSKADGPSGPTSSEGQGPASAASPAESAPGVDDRPSSPPAAEPVEFSGPRSQPDGTQSPGRPAESNESSGPCSQPAGAEPSSRPADDANDDGPRSQTDGTQPPSRPASSDNAAGQSRRFDSVEARPAAAEENNGSTQTVHESNRKQPAPPGMTSFRATAQDVNCLAGQTGSGRVGSGRVGPGGGVQSMADADARQRTTGSSLPSGSRSARRRRRRKR